MALNKLALIRYKTLDVCLSNRSRKWTLENLIEKVSDALFEYEGIENGVSKRTIQLDLQTMRSDKLGYSAPIMVLEKKFYTYDDPKFSITKSKITNADLEKMTEVVGILRHLNGFSHFGEMTELVAKLENNLRRNTENTPNLIQFESNPMLKGLNWLDILYRAVLQKTAVALEYQSFKARGKRTDIYFPYLLKEYRNRWFLVVGLKANPKVFLNLALDRIGNVEILEKEPFIPFQGESLDTYYKDVIGVTKLPFDRPSVVVLEFDAITAPYVLTKPLHDSQQILRHEAGVLLISITVVLNFELEREILGFGEAVRVLGPRRLEARISKRLAAAAGRYLKEKAEGLPVFHR
jgi:predicted DNA-binding transcriptional regulator YafY